METCKRTDDPVNGKEFISSNDGHFAANLACFYMPIYVRRGLSLEKQRELIISFVKRKTKENGQGVMDFLVKELKFPTT